MSPLSRRAALSALGAAVILPMLPKPARAADNSVDAIKKRGQLIAGVKFDSPNWGYLNPNGGTEPTGFDVDIAKALAKQILGDEKKIKFVQVTSANRIPQTQNGDIDLFVATATITPKRLEQINFSNVYYRAGQSLLVKADSKITGYKDLAGKTVATVKGSTPETTIRRVAPQANVTTFDSYPDCYQALLQGRADAMTTDNVILAGFEQQDPKATKLVGGLFTFEPYGIGINKGNDSLTKAVNDGLAAIGKDGEYKTIYERWLKKPLPADWSSWYDMPAQKAADAYAADQPKT
jgi:putative glutamine transport system substrate-binding protein